ncbi:MAG: hypothetical protein CW345_08450 [Firmicutes bacterium]|nr:hypothetical protein [Bacillota bacterium]MBO2521817.1 hypothetical protein [Bacillota bacterium]
MQAAAGKRAAWLRYVPFLVLAAFLAAAFLYHQRLDARAEVGAPAPDFTLETLDGGKLSLSDLRGKAVLINFWTTWCPECKDELPALEAFQRRWGHRIALLGVNMRETEGLVRPFVQRYGVTYPILLDRFERVSKVYQVTGVPETWLVDADGIAVARFIGPLTEAHLARAVELLLGDEAAGGPGESGPGGAS